MNSRLLKEISDNKKYVSKSYEVARHSEYSKNTIYCQPTCALSALVSIINKHYDDKKYNLAGKNLSEFDLPFIKRLHRGHENLFKYHRRILDPSIYYLNIEDKQLPNLTECLDRAGMQPTDLHTAIGDAWDICRLIRHHYNLNIDHPVGFFDEKEVFSSC